VYSKTTSWVLKSGPIVGLSSLMMALCFVPLDGAPALISFNGDFVLLLYLMGLTRFFTVIAALDTGSSFEGMGASREVQFSALAEPVMLFGLAVLAKLTNHLSLSDMFGALSGHNWIKAGPELALISVAFFVVFLTENARIPVDDPNTHLELTMIHEVMVLDMSGPDFAYVLYGCALKLWILGSILIGIAMPIHDLHPLLGILVSVVGLLGLSILTGIVESIMARLRLTRVPQMLIGAVVLTVVALIFVLR
jgi:formate hydrogenlyase subunit 4